MFIWLVAGLSGGWCNEPIAARLLTLNQLVRELHESLRSLLSSSKFNSLDRYNIGALFVQCVGVLSSIPPADTRSYMYNLCSLSNVPEMGTSIVKY